MILPSILLKVQSNVGTTESFSYSWEIYSLLQEVISVQQLELVYYHCDLRLLEVNKIN